MLYTKNKLPCMPNTSYTNPILFLDIETTGLSKSSHHIVLIGCLYCMGSEAVYHTWLSKSIESEKDAISSFLSFLSPQYKLYTYGGTTFDLAFIYQKATDYNLDTSLFQAITKVDFKQLPFFKSLMKYNNLKRPSLEEMLSYSRQSTLSGRELVKMSQLYQTTHEAIYSDLLKRHNQDELLSLISLWHFYQLISCIHPTCYVQLTEDEPCLTFVFQPSFLYPSDCSFDFDIFEVHYSTKKNLLYVTLTAEQKILQKALPYKDYYIVNGELMHRSLAQFIPSTHKVKATRTTAFIQKEDIYISSPSLDEAWKDIANKSYIPFSDFKTYEQDYIKYFHKKITRD